MLWPDFFTVIGGGAFSGCSGLTSVLIPNSVTKIGNQAFSGCSGLTSIIIPNSVTNIGGQAFWNCSGLKSVYIGKGIKNFGMDIWEGCPNIRKVVYIGDTRVGVEGKSFEWDVWQKATLYVLEENITWAKWTMPWKYFNRIEKYVSKELQAGDDFEYNGITYTVIDPEAKTVKTKDGEVDQNGYINYGNMVSGNLVLPENVYHDFDCYTLTEIGDDGFYNCKELTSITIPNSITKIGRSAFDSCSGLTSVIIPNSVSEMGEYAFCVCSNLTSVEIPYSITEISEGTFAECDNLTSVQIPNSVTKIGEYAFFDCMSLTSIEIPNSVTKIGEYAFCACISLTSIEIPNSVTRIGGDTFRYCSSLTSVSIGNGIQEFGSSIWMDCPNIEEVYYAAEHPIEGTTGMFDSEVYAYATLHLPAEAIDEAKTINPWKLFSSIQAYDFSAGIDDVMVDEDPDAKVEVYNFSGLKVFDGPRSEIALPRGYYILIQNSKPSKVLLGY